jgi:hypothetical protein
VGLLAAIFQKIKAQKLKETINSFQKEAKWYRNLPTCHKRRHPPWCRIPLQKPKHF